MRWSFFSMTTYSGAKSCRVSTPNPLLGRSMMWPIEARTSKSLPRNFSMVFALAGDSTITRCFAMPWSTYLDNYRFHRVCARPTPHLLFAETADLFAYRVPHLLNGVYLLMCTS